MNFRDEVPEGIVQALTSLKSYTPQYTQTFLSWLCVVIILNTPSSPLFAFWGSDQTTHITVTGSCNEVPPQAGKLYSQWQDEELSFERSQLMYFRSSLKSPLRLPLKGLPALTNLEMALKATQDMLDQLGLPFSQRAPWDVRRAHCESVSIAL